MGKNNFEEVLLYLNVAVFSQNIPSGQLCPRENKDTWKKILLHNWFSKSFVLVQTRALLSPIDFPRPYYLVYLDDIRYLQKCGNSSHIPDPHTCITLLDSLV